MARSILLQLAPLRAGLGPGKLSDPRQLQLVWGSQKTHLFAGSAADLLFPENYSSPGNRINHLQYDVLACPQLWVLWPGQPLCAERDTEAVNHGPLSASVHKQLIWKCFISALLKKNRTTLLQPPALSSLTLHPSVFQPKIPHQLTQSRCISSLCSRLRAVRELTAS